jgi:hypothetical protein
LAEKQFFTAYKMAHGPDTAELLRRIANIHDNKLDVSGLNITSLPDLPSELQKLYCSNTNLTILPALPSGLQILECANTNITTLLDLPSGLQKFWCDNTLLVWGKTESIQNYNERWRKWREEQASKKRSQERSKVIKRDLVENVWHPRRVQKLLEAGVELELF